MYDYIGGDITAKIFKMMPQKSEVAVIGCLSGQSIPFDSSDLIFNSKVIRGHILHDWLTKVSDADKQMYLKEVSDDLKTGGKLYGSVIARTLNLSDFKKAIEENEQYASMGKTLIKCNDY